MSAPARLRYFGWSALSIETAQGSLYFDPFYRPYCGAEWFHLNDFVDADYVCVTHGHEEHFLDVPIIAEAGKAVIIGSPAVCRFLERRRGIAHERLRPIAPATFEEVSVPGFTITAMPWKHRDINLYKALARAVFEGNTTQLSWAWSSAVNAPFYAPYTGFHVRLPDGLTVLNYNEGFNSKMTDAEIALIGKKFRTDVLLAGMQLNFVEDIARGVAAIQPGTVVLYPPHEKFHEMMGAKSRPWGDFRQAILARCPRVQVHLAQPGFELDLLS